MEKNVYVITLLLDPNIDEGVNPTFTYKSITHAHYAISDFIEQGYQVAIEMQ